MIDDGLQMQIIGKYEHYFCGPRALRGLVYFLTLVENHHLEVEIKAGKIIGEQGGYYLIKYGVETRRIRKHLCFHRYEQALKFFSAISIDELRIIS